MSSKWFKNHWTLRVHWLSRAPRSIVDLLFSYSGGGIFFSSGNWNCTSIFHPYTVTLGSRAQETICVQTWHGIPPSWSDRSWTSGKVCVYHSSLSSYLRLQAENCFFITRTWMIFINGMTVTAYSVWPLTSCDCTLPSKASVTWLDT